MRDLDKEMHVYTEWSVANGGFAKDMTLRDHYAGLAMQGLIARESTGAFNFEACPNDPWRVALWAYDVADQMLRVRSKE